jgi:hypothetical protein
MRIQSVQTVGAQTIGDYYREAISKAIAQVASYSHEKLIGMDTDELVAYLTQEYALSPLEIDESRQLEYNKVVKKEPFETIFGDTGYKEILCARVVLPIKRGINIAGALQYMTNTFTLKVYEFDFDEVNFTITFDATPDTVEGKIGEYRTLFQQRTADIQTNTTEFKQQLSAAIEHRKKKIREDTDTFDAMMQKISIPLKKRGGEPSYHVPLHIRNDIKKLTVPTSTPPKTLELTQEQLDSIIKVIDVDGRNFENAPETYSQLDEPDLRNIIVGHLNHYFPGDVTGETFVKLGKADIRLKVFAGEILIAECKYWNGEEEFLKAIDQLFRYLTWRHNYGLVIVFSKNYGFTDVLNRIKEATQKHASYQGGFTELADTHFRSVHKFPDDPQKQIEVHILAYNLYYNKNTTS